LFLPNEKKSAHRAGPRLVMIIIKAYLVTLPGVVVDLVVLLVPKCKIFLVILQAQVLLLEIQKGYILQNTSNVEYKQIVLNL
jgi:hypothetical protein